ncbi:MAG: hypothetical protein E6G39_12760 [Actinobacteria bacterium]|nr:MAG: hypothetical protein E6G39_12760 [Actinomycetota bacterium]
MRCECRRRVGRAPSAGAPPLVLPGPVDGDDRSPCHHGASRGLAPTQISQRGTRGTLGTRGSGEHSCARRALQQQWRQVMELPDGVYDGIDQIKTIFTGTKGRLADFGLGTGKQFYMRHYTATHQVDLLDQTHAKGRCYYQVIMAHGLDHWGRYIDEYELREGRWLFTNRKVSMDGYVAGGFGAASDV